MDDLIDNDFRPLQLAYTMDEAFPLGQVLIAADTADLVEPAFVQESLARHAAGDWGEVDRLLKWGNARTLRGDHAMPIVSKYPVGGGRLQITTKADGSVTSVILYEAGHAPSPPDAKLPRPLRRLRDPRRAGIQRRQGQGSRRLRRCGILGRVRPCSRTGPGADRRFPDPGAPRKSMPASPAAATRAGLNLFNHLRSEHHERRPRR